MLLARNSFAVLAAAGAVTTGEVRVPQGQHLVLTHVFGAVGNLGTAAGMRITLTIDGYAVDFPGFGVCELKYPLVVTSTITVTLTNDTSSGSLNANVGFLGHLVPADKSRVDAIMPGQSLNKWAGD